MTKVRLLHRAEADLILIALADAAVAFGYADQAHMTRATKSWLGVTPTAIKPGTELFYRLDERGYG